MYQVQTKVDNRNEWNTSPVRFASEEIALKHAEKLADQFIHISDYRVVEVAVAA